VKRMAAFCGCCGAKIIDAAEACPVCGMPRHGMLPVGLPISLAEDEGPMCCQGNLDEAGSGEEPRRRAPVDLDGQ